MPRSAGIVCAAAAAALTGAALVTGQIHVVDGDGSTCPAAAPMHGRAEVGKRTAPASHHDDHVVVGPTCNRVEMVPPAESTYVPDLADASPADRVRARDLLRGANEFCRTHEASRLAAEWTPGTNDPQSPTHYFNPRRDSLGADPRNPRAALVYQGEVGGVMLTGVPLPALGAIPRAHHHGGSRPREMVHVYCTSNLREAFTPDRELGVLLDVRTLRARIRPRVAELSESRLRDVLRLVRTHAVGKALPTAPTSGPPEVDPVLFARRDEVRRSLMVLDEAQLRSVWKAVRGTGRPG